MPRDDRDMREYRAASVEAHIKRLDQWIINRKAYDYDTRDLEVCVEMLHQLHKKLVVEELTNA